ncbi:MAG TPA: CPBP family intramembrane glutamic endopeptidase [Candidatus Acidoferrum sp.]|nr:CPBP family intramembrane glutamic endopeptidase [Candidatus Acidoferrum sp.]
MHVLPSTAAVENVAFQLLILVGLIAVAGLAARRVPDLRLAAIVVGSLALAHLAVFTSLVPAAVLHAHWNWAGKILSIVVTLALIAMIPSLSWDAAGFRWSQNGAIVPALIACAIVWAFSWSIDLLLPHPHVAPTAEALWYQALIPGPSEEPLYRGLALVLLDRAFGNRYWKVLGAPFGFGAIITSIWFGVIHGSGIAGGQIVVSWLTIAVTGTIGFVFAWIRMRTGSLVIPIVAHAVIDVGDTIIG